MLKKKTQTKIEGPIPYWRREPDVIEWRKAVAGVEAARPAVDENQARADAARAANNELAEALVELNLATSPPDREAAEKRVADARQSAVNARAKTQFDASDYNEQLNVARQTLAVVEERAKKRVASELAPEFIASLETIEEAVRALVPALDRAIALREAIVDQYQPDDGWGFPTWAPFNRIGLVELNGFPSPVSNRFYLLCEIEKLVKMYRERGLSL